MSVDKVALLLDNKALRKERDAAWEALDAWKAWIEYRKRIWQVSGGETDSSSEEYAMGEKADKLTDKALAMRQEK